MRKYQLFFAGLGALCVLAIGLNLIVRQGPVHDATAVSDIHNITAAIDNFRANQNQLPVSLDDLSGLGSTAGRLDEYEYQVVDEITYQVCATFVADSRNTVRPYSVVSGQPDPAIHAAGRQCFTFDSTANYPEKPLPR